MIQQHDESVVLDINLVDRDNNPLDVSGAVITCVVSYPGEVRRQKAVAVQLTNPHKGEGFVILEKGMFQENGNIIVQNIINMNGVEYRTDAVIQYISWSIPIGGNSSVCV